MTMLNVMMMMLVIKLKTMMLKTEDSIQIWADTISGLYCSLYWEMTSIRMTLKKSMMEITLSLSISLSFVCY